MSNKLNQDKWMGYEDDIIKYYYKYWKEWLDNPKRKPSGIAFTSGLGRDVANLMEDAMRVREYEILKKLIEIRTIMENSEYITIANCINLLENLEKQIKNGK